MLFWDVLAVLKSRIHKLHLAKWALNVCASLSAGEERSIIIIIWLISPHFPWDLLFCEGVTESKEDWHDYSTSFALTLFLHRGSPVLLSCVASFQPALPVFLNEPVYGLTVTCVPSQTRIIQSHPSTATDVLYANTKQRPTCVLLWPVCVCSSQNVIILRWLRWLAVNNGDEICPSQSGGFVYVYDSVCLRVLVQRGGRWSHALCFLPSAPSLLPWRDRSLLSHRRRN